MCKARRYGDQYHCHACGFQWDVDDEDRPMCKSGNAVRMLGVALTLCVSGAASAETNCDAVRVAALTSSTLAYAEVCSATMDRYGKNTALQSSECLLAVIESTKQDEAIQGLQDRGCTSYVNLPPATQVTRLRALGIKFSTTSR